MVFPSTQGPVKGWRKHNSQSQPRLTFLFLFLANTTSRISFLLFWTAFWLILFFLELLPSLTWAPKISLCPIPLDSHVSQNCVSSATLTCPCDLNVEVFTLLQSDTAVCPMFLLKHAISCTQCLSAMGMSGRRTLGL